jgi:hypothetical protein
VEEGPQEVVGSEGDVEVRDTVGVLRNWESIKASERAERQPGSEPQSGLSSVPAILPALARAQAFGERAARAGFDWPDQITITVIGAGVVVTVVVSGIDYVWSWARRARAGAAQEESDNQTSETSE